MGVSTMSEQNQEGCFEEYYWVLYNYILDLINN